MGKRGVDVLREVFARSFVVALLISSQLADQEARRLVLTKDQIRVLDFLRSHRRVAVSGGAGTGKTVLALEKARRLASEGLLGVSGQTIDHWEAGKAKPRASQLPRIDALRMLTKKGAAAAISQVMG